jgi:5-methylcytosine-specific restriction enzyme B
MSLGAIGSEDHVYSAAVAGNYIALGWGGDVDWSDPRFADNNEMRKEWAARSPEDKTPSQTDQPWVLRNKVRVGDLVIVPYGNSAFRAVAEVMGEYYFELSEEGNYNHRRKVRWLLTLDEPLPLDTIVGGNFTMRTLYEIREERIRKESLTRLLGGLNEVARPTSPDQFVLVIDEINRANISKVFGELITLIEPDKRIGGAYELKAILPYSKESLGVPDNLHIIGTMNTADRSIALLDTALRRRFEFRELMPQPEKLGTVDGLDLKLLLTTINERIEYLFDREHQIGHGFFMRCESRADVDDVMRLKVIPLLTEYFYDDWNKVAAVLGDADDGEGGFLDRRQLKAPRLGGEDEPAPRYRWQVRDKFDYGKLQ